LTAAADQLGEPMGRGRSIRGRWWRTGPLSATPVSNPEGKKRRGKRKEKFRPTAGFPRWLGNTGREDLDDGWRWDAPLHFAGACFGGRGAGLNPPPPLLPARGRWPEAKGGFRRSQGAGRDRGRLRWRRCRPRWAWQEAGGGRGRRWLPPWWDMGVGRVRPGGAFQRRLARSVGGLRK